MRGRGEKDLARSREAHPGLRKGGARSPALPRIPLGTARGAVDEARAAELYGGLRRLGGTDCARWMLHLRSFQVGREGSPRQSARDLFQAACVTGWPTPVPASAHVRTGKGWAHQTVAFGYTAGLRRRICRAVTTCVLDTLAAASRRTRRAAGSMNVPAAGSPPPARSASSTPGRGAKDTDGCALFARACDGDEALAVSTSPRSRGRLGVTLTMTGARHTAAPVSGV